MLVFIDESGDSGFKIDQGSSEYFVVSLVVFEELDEANTCDQRIELLKKELGKGNEWEFHFKTNSHRIRKQFLEAVLPYNFFYYGIVINKSKLYGEGFRNKESFYKYTCSLVFENAKEKLDNAIVLIDRSGSKDFKRSLSKYLKFKMNDGDDKLIKKVKMQASHSNNLLQLADYIAGIINRRFQQKKFSEEYQAIISSREIFVQFWPK